MNSPITDRCNLDSFQVLGVRVHIAKTQEIVSIMEQWCNTPPRRAHWIVVTGMHGVIEAHRDPQFRAIVNSAELFVPDGISLVWVARHFGLPLERRVTGTDLMWEFCKRASERGYRQYFYGDTDDTLSRLVTRLREELPNIGIAGFYSPPFRPLTSEEDEEIIRRINRANVDVLWVGLGLPKQERWIFHHKDKLNVPVIIGVGAAFKFLGGLVKRAPTWIGDHGLEWLWRLLHEPRRVWQRVLLDGPLFVGHVLMQLSGLRKYN